MYNFKNEDKVFLYSTLLAVVYAVSSVFVLIVGMEKIAVKLDVLFGAPFLSAVSFLSMSLWCCFIILFLGGIARVMYSARGRCTMGYIVMAVAVFFIQAAVAFIQFFILLGKWKLPAVVLFVLAGVLMVLQIRHLARAVQNGENLYDIQD